jgi:hypothetical protein
MLDIQPGFGINPCGTEFAVQSLSTSLSKRAHKPSRGRRRIPTHRKAVPLLSTYWKENLPNRRLPNRRVVPSLAPLALHPLAAQVEASPPTCLTVEYLPLAVRYPPVSCKLSMNQKRLPTHLRTRKAHASLQPHTSIRMSCRAYSPPGMSVEAWAVENGKERNNPPSSPLLVHRPKSPARSPSMSTDVGCLDIGG